MLLPGFTGTFRYKKKSEKEFFLIATTLKTSQLGNLAIEENRTTTFKICSSSFKFVFYSWESILYMLNE